MYYLEIGANQHPSKVIYDRAHSAISKVKPGIIPWSRIFSDARWFHFTGITSGISQTAADACFEAVTLAREKGLTVSYDLNYRAKVWKCDKIAREGMSNLMPYVDILIGSEEDCEKVFGTKGTDISVAEECPGRVLGSDRQTDAAPTNLKKVCISLRGSISASHDTWFDHGSRGYRRTLSLQCIRP